MRHGGYYARKEGAKACRTEYSGNDEPGTAFRRSTARPKFRRSAETDCRLFCKRKNHGIFMLVVVILGTLCGVYAPSLQSNAVDIIAKNKSGNLLATLILMTVVYVLYSVGQLLQGLISARLSQRIVKRMREELFSKLMDLPVRYLDTHSHGDVMSRMTNDIENISTTVSQSLPSLFSGVLTVIGTVSIMLW